MIATIAILLLRSGWGEPRPEILLDFGFVEATYPPARAFNFRETQARFSVDKVMIEKDGWGDTHI
jgi:hypothetical protein